MLSCTTLHIHLDIFLSVGVNPIVLSLLNDSGQPPGAVPRPEQLDQGDRGGGQLGHEDGVRHGRTGRVGAAAARPRALGLVLLIVEKLASWPIEAGPVNPIGLTSFGLVFNILIKLTKLLKLRDQQTFI